MSKYSLLGVCQPQRGGLSYFCGLSLLPTCDGHCDRDCRSDDGPRCLSHMIDYLRTYRDSPLTFLLLPLFLRLPPTCLNPISVLLAAEIQRSLAVTLNSSELSGRLCQYGVPHGLRDPRGIGRDRMRKAEDRMEEGELPVLASWTHVPVSRSAEKRGLRGSINMRMTRAAWFCALPDAHRVDIFIPVLEFMLNCEKLERWTMRFSTLE